jgi:hypothetical protein
MKEVDLEKYALWIEEKKSFSLIREDLLSKGFSFDEVKLILIDLDDHLIKLQQSKINRSQGIQWIISGVILTGISSLVFLFGFIPLTFFAYGGILSGVGMVVWGKNKLTQDETSISKKRSTYFRRTKSK